MLDDVDFPNEIFGFNFTEYLTIFVALIFALAVAEFFISLGTMIRQKHLVKFHWEFILWLVVILDFFIVSWFIYWPRLIYLKGSLLSYFALIFPYLIIFIIVSVYFPEMRNANAIDLKEHFLKIRKTFFLLFAFYVFTNDLIDIFMPTQATLFAVASQSVYVLALVIAAFYDRVWFRTVTALMFLAHLIFMMAYL